MNFTATTSFNSAVSHKIVFLGNSGVGKTSIVQRIAYGRFDSNPQPTVILDTLRKNVIHEGKVRRLQLWDTAGQEKFSSLIPSSVRDNDCAIIVYDASNPDTLKGCQRWLKMLEDTCTPSSAIILLANKIDIQKGDNGKGFQFAVKFGLDYMQVSAATGAGIEDLINEIIVNIDNIGKEEKQTCSTENSGRLSTKGSFKFGSDKIVNLSQNSKSGRIELRKQKSIVLKNNSRNSCCSI